jgi:hypothetical protein
MLVRAHPHGNNGGEQLVGEENVFEKFVQYPRHFEEENRTSERK